MSPFLSTQYWHWTDRRTDRIDKRRLPTANRSRVSMSGRPCKNLPHVYFDHPIKFGCCFSHCACAYVGIPRHLGDAGALPLGTGHSWHLGCGRGWPLEICFSPAYVTTSNSVILGQPIRAWLWRSTRKFWPLTLRFSRSLKVIGTDADRSATLYDFLLVFHCSIVT